MQEAALEADRYERGDGRAEKGVAGSGRPRYCRKCQVGAWSGAESLHVNLHAAAC